MDLLGPLLGFGLMWLVANALRKAGSTASRKPGAPAPSTRAPRPVVRSLPPAPGTDATQREGMQLERLLRELGRTLDQSAGPLGRAPDKRLPEAEDVEEGRSLEATPREARSLEPAPARRERAVVDLDDEAEQLIARRAAAAEANAAPRTRAEHAAFEARIKAQPADKTATRGYTAKQLREAVVWREIFGRPVSLRGEGEE